MPYERSGGKQCIACSNNQRDIYYWKSSICELHGEKHEYCVCIAPFRFHCLPTDSERRRDWLQVIGRKNYNPSGQALVCSRHFKDGRPTAQYPYPTENVIHRMKVDMLPAGETDREQHSGHVIPENIRRKLNYGRYTKMFDTKKTWCVVDYCLNHVGMSWKNFFPFPDPSKGMKDRFKCIKWMTAINQLEYQTSKLKVEHFLNNPRKRKVICEEHFKPEDFTKDKKKDSHKIQLIEGAYPRVFDFRQIDMFEKCARLEGSDTADENNRKRGKSSTKPEKVKKRKLSKDNVAGILHTTSNQMNTSALGEKNKGSEHIEKIEATVIHMEAENMDLHELGPNITPDIVDDANRLENLDLVEVKVENVDPQELRPSIIQKKLDDVNPAENLDLGEIKAEYVDPDISEHFDNGPPLESEKTVDLSVKTGHFDSLDQNSHCIKTIKLVQEGIPTMIETENQDHETNQVSSFSMTNNKSSHALKAIIVPSASRMKSSLEDFKSKEKACINQDKLKECIVIKQTNQGQTKSKQGKLSIMMPKSLYTIVKNPGKTSKRVIFPMPTNLIPPTLLGSNSTESQSNFCTPTVQKNKNENLVVANVSKERDFQRDIFHTKNMHSYSQTPSCNTKAPQVDSSKIVDGQGNLEVANQSKHGDVHHTRNMQSFSLCSEGEAQITQVDSCGKSIMNNGKQCLDNVSTVKQEVGDSFDFSSNNSQEYLDGVSTVKQEVVDPFDITSNCSKQCLDRVSKVKQDVGDSIYITSNSDKQCLNSVSTVKQEVVGPIDITSNRNEECLNSVSTVKQEVVGPIDITSNRNEECLNSVSIVKQEVVGPIDITSNREEECLKSVSTMKQKVADSIDITSNSDKQCLNSVSTVKQEVVGPIDITSNRNEECLNSVSTVKQEVIGPIDITSNRNEECLNNVSTVKHKVVGPFYVASNSGKGCIDSASTENKKVLGPFYITSKIGKEYLESVSTAKLKVVGQFDITSNRDKECQDRASTAKQEVGGPNDITSNTEQECLDWASTAKQEACGPIDITSNTEQECLDWASTVKEEVDELNVLTSSSDQERQDRLSTNDFTSNSDQGGLCNVSSIKQEIYEPNETSMCLANTNQQDSQVDSCRNTMSHAGHVDLDRIPSIKQEKDDYQEYTLDNHLSHVSLVQDTDTQKPTDSLSGKHMLSDGECHLDRNTQLKQEEVDDHQTNMGSFLSDTDAQKHSVNDAVQNRSDGVSGGNTPLNHEWVPFDPKDGSQESANKLYRVTILKKGQVCLQAEKSQEKDDHISKIPSLSSDKSSRNSPVSNTGQVGQAKLQPLPVVKSIAINSLSSLPVKNVSKHSQVSSENPSRNNTGQASQTSLSSSVQGNVILDSISSLLLNNISQPLTKNPSRNIPIINTGTGQGGQAKHNSLVCIFPKQNMSLCLPPNTDLQKYSDKLRTAKLSQSGQTHTDRDTVRNKQEGTLSPWINSRSQFPAKQCEVALPSGEQVNVEREPEEAVPRPMMLVANKHCTDFPSYGQATVAVLGNGNCIKKAEDKRDYKKAEDKRDRVKRLIQKMKLARQNRESDVNRNLTETQQRFPDQQIKYKLDSQTNMLYRLHGDIVQNLPNSNKQDQQKNIHKTQKSVVDLLKSMQYPNKSMQDPKKSMQNPNKSMQYPKKSMQDPDKSMQDPKKSMQDSKKSMEDPKKSMQDPNKSMQYPDKSMQDPKKSMQDPNKSMQDPNKSMQNPNKSMQNPKKSMQDPKKSMQYPKKSMQDPKKSMQDPKNSMQDPKKSMQYPKKSMQDPKKSMQDPKNSMQDPKKIMQDPKRSMPDQGIDTSHTHNRRLSRGMILPEGNKKGLPRKQTKEANNNCPMKQQYRSLIDHEELISKTKEQSIELDVEKADNSDENNTVEWAQVRGKTKKNYDRWIIYNQESTVRGQTEKNNDRLMCDMEDYMGRIGNLDEKELKRRKYEGFITDHTYAMSPDKDGKILKTSSSKQNSKTYKYRPSSPKWYDNYEVTLDIPEPVSPGDFSPVPLPPLVKPTYIMFSLKATDKIIGTKIPDIIQIAAYESTSGELFEAIIKGKSMTPTQFATAMGQTQFGMHAENNIVGEPVTMLEAAVQLIEWLEKYNSPILVANGGKNFHFPVLISALVKIGCFERFRLSITALSDSKFFFQKISKTIYYYELDFLARDLFDEEYESKDALEDVKMLNKILVHIFTLSDVPDLESAFQNITFIPEAVKNQLQFQENIAKNIGSYELFISNDVMEGHTARRLAGSGYAFCHFRAIVERDGAKGLFKTFRCHMRKGGGRDHCHIPNFEVFVQKLVKYFKNH